MGFQGKHQRLASLDTYGEHTCKARLSAPHLHRKYLLCKKWEPKWLQWPSFLTCLISSGQGTWITARDLQLTETNSKQSWTWKTKLIVTDLWSPLNSKWQFFPQWKKCHFHIITFHSQIQKNMHIFKKKTCFKMPTPPYLQGSSQHHYNKLSFKG